MIYFKYKEIDHQHFSRDYNGWMLNNQTMPKELVNLFICFYLSVIPSCREYLLVIVKGRHERKGNRKRSKTILSTL